MKRARSLAVPFVVTLLASAGLPAAPAEAHPHVFVDTGLSLNFDDQGRLGAISVVWIFDELTSLLVVEDLTLDPDGDGILTGAETAALVERAGDWPDDFDGNLHLTSKGAPVALSRPLSVTAEYRDGRLIATHIRGLIDRIDPAQADLSLRVYDPTYYTFYSLAGTPRIVGRDDCTATIMAADLDEALKIQDEALAGLSPEDLADDSVFPEIGSAFADEVRLTCVSPP